MTVEERVRRRVVPAMKWKGAAASGNRAVHSIPTGQIPTEWTDEAWSKSMGKWSGDGAVVAEAVYFAPSNNDNILYLNTVGEVVGLIPTDRTGDGKWDGAAAVGSTVYFTPFNCDDILVLDTCTNTVSFIPSGVAHVADGWRQMEGRSPFGGARGMGSTGNILSLRPVAQVACVAAPAGPSRQFICSQQWGGTLIAHQTDDDQGNGAADGSCVADATALKNAVGAENIDCGTQPDQFPQLRSNAGNNLDQCRADAARETSAPPSAAPSVVPTSAPTPPPTAAPSSTAPVLRSAAPISAAPSASPMLTPATPVLAACAAGVTAADRLSTCLAYPYQNGSRYR
eukprot:gene33952-biopygen119790